MKNRCTLGLLALAALVTMPLGAQVDDEVVAGIQFNFTPPGARGLAMGGAFLAVADDATTAFTNPAGITNLTVKEIAAEVRQATPSSLFPESGSGNFSSFDFGTGDAAGFDDSGITYGETDEDTLGLAFISYVQPLGNARLAFYRHELVNFESSFRANGPVVNVAGSPIGRAFPASSDLDLKIEDFGASFAYEFADKFSIGVGVNFYSFDISSQTDRFNFVFLEAPNFSASNLYASQVQNGDDDDIGVNVGMLWDVNEMFSIGAAYRSGVSFDYNYTVSCGPAADQFCGPLAGTFPAVFNAPDVFGIGIAIKPTATFKILIDYDNVQYSALTEDFTTPASNASPADFSVEDADEVHLGFEYFFANLRNPIAVRWGAWHDPAHQIGYRGANPLLNILWTGPERLSDDEIHYTAGLGFFFGEVFSLDVAGDFSDRSDVMSLSAAYRF